MAEVTKKSRAVLVKEFVDASDPEVSGGEFNKAMEEAVELLPDEYKREFVDLGAAGQLPSPEFLAFWESNALFQEAAKRVFAEFAKVGEGVLRTTRALAE